MDGPAGTNQGRPSFNHALGLNAAALAFIDYKEHDAIFPEFAPLAHEAWPDAPWADASDLTFTGSDLAQRLTLGGDSSLASGSADLDWDAPEPEPLPSAWGSAWPTVAPPPHWAPPAAPDARAHSLDSRSDGSGGCGAGPARADTSPAPAARARPLDAPAAPKAKTRKAGKREKVLARRAELNRAYRASVKARASELESRVASLAAQAAALGALDSENGVFRAMVAATHDAKAYYGAEACTTLVPGNPDGRHDASLQAAWGAAMAAADRGRPIVRSAAARVAAGEPEPVGTLAPLLCELTTGMTRCMQALMGGDSGGVTTARLMTADPDGGVGAGHGAAWRRLVPAIVALQPPLSPHQLEQYGALGARHTKWLGQIYGGRPQAVAAVRQKLEAMPAVVGVDGGWGGVGDAMDLAGRVEDLVASLDEEIEEGTALAAGGHFRILTPLQLLQIYWADGVAAVPSSWSVLSSISLARQEGLL